MASPKLRRGFDGPRFGGGRVGLRERFGPFALLCENASKPVPRALGFSGDNKVMMRTIHAYLGSTVMILFIIHAIFGLNLGFSI